MKKTLISIVVVPACSLAIFLGLRSFAGPGSRSLKDYDIITIAAASSLIEPFSEMAQAFEKANNGTKVVLTFAASGVISRQVEQGAPVDVLATADDLTMARAEAANCLVPGTRTVFAGNDLVIVVPAESELRISSLEELRRESFGRIAVGNPAFVPAGQYAKKGLAAYNLWDELGPKLVFGNSVRQVLDYAARGEVDAAIVFATDPPAARGEVRAAGKIPLAKEPAYPIALVAGSNNMAVSTRFLSFVVSPQGQKILHRYGFKSPKTAPNTALETTHADSR